MSSSPVRPAGDGGGVGEREDVLSRDMCRSLSETGGERSAAGQGARLIKFQAVTSALPSLGSSNRDRSESTALLLSSSYRSGGGTEYKAITRSTSSSGSGGDDPAVPQCHHGNEHDICIPCDDEELNTDADHCHPRQGAVTPHDIKTNNNRSARRKLIFASVLCTFFMAGEAVGGYLANSLAVMTDAAHLLTDLASFMISLFALYIASRPATTRMSFGYYRAEVIGALVSVLMIWVITGILVYLAVERIISADYEIGGEIMVITSGIAIAVNIVMGIALHNHGHTHGGGSSHSHLAVPSKASQPQAKGGKGKGNVNINVRAAFIHVIGDLLQSIGVFAAALIIYYKPEYKIADPICTFLFSVLVLFTTMAILKDTLNVLMEGTPRGLDFGEIKRTLRNVKGVIEVHNLRIWSLTMDKAAMSAHLAIEPQMSAKNVLKEASKILRVRFGVYECTMQIEEFTDDMMDCTQCKDPKD